MKINKALAALFSAFCVLALSARIAHPEANVIANLVRVYMVITDQAFTEKSEAPVLGAQNVTMKQGENALKVDQVISAQGDNAGIQLMILIDDTIDSHISKTYRAVDRRQETCTSETFSSRRSC